MSAQRFTRKPQASASGENSPHPLWPWRLWVSCLLRECSSALSSQWQTGLPTPVSFPFSFSLPLSLSPFLLLSPSLSLSLPLSLSLSLSLTHTHTHTHTCLKLQETEVGCQQAFPMGWLRKQPWLERVGKTMHCIGLSNPSRWMLKANKFSRSRHSYSLLPWKHLFLAVGLTSLHSGPVGDPRAAGPCCFRGETLDGDVREARLCPWGCLKSAGCGLSVSPPSLVRSCLGWWHHLLMALSSWVCRWEEGFQVVGCWGGIFHLCGPLRVSASLSCSLFIEGFVWSSPSLPNLLFSFLLAFTLTFPQAGPI